MVFFQKTYIHLSTNLCLFLTILERIEEHTTLRHIIILRVTNNYKTNHIKAVIKILSLDSTWILEQKSVSAGNLALLINISPFHRSRILWLRFFARKTISNRIYSSRFTTYNKQLLMSNSTSRTKTKTLSNRTQKPSRTAMMVCTFILTNMLYKHELQVEKLKHSSALVLMNDPVLKNCEDYDLDYWNQMEIQLNGLQT